MTAAKNRLLIQALSALLFLKVGLAKLVASLFASTKMSNIGLG